jgi:hypothetical protein
VTDRQMTLQALQGELVERLRNQTEFLEDDHRLPVGDRDAGRLLAAMLQRIEPVVREASHVLSGGVDTHDAAGVPGFAAHDWLRVEADIRLGNPSS